MSSSHQPVGRWADFARGLVAGEEEETMRRHLDDGCPTCERRLETVRRLAALARADAGVTPPAAAMRMAKSVAALAPFVETAAAPRPRAVPMTRVFDSALAPAPTGVRTQRISERQLVFESPSYTLHLHLGPPTEKEPAGVTGVLLRPSGDPIPGVPACLVAEDGTTSFAFTSDQGNFNLPAGLAASGELRLLVTDDDRLAIEL